MAWMLTLTLLLIVMPCFAFDEHSAVAFYYADDPPLDELHAFNVVVVPYPNKLPVKAFNNASSQLYAYVSIGELDADAPFRKEANLAWKIGANRAWNSTVMDLANPAWRDFLLTKVIGPAYEAGYRGFFLDTLDSYQSLKLSTNAEQAQLDGEVDLIKKIKERYPDAAIILNRGFEILDRVHADIQAVAAESLFRAWNANRKKYEPVADSERQWLLKKLQDTQKAYHLPVIVIDYLPATAREEARLVARKIMDLGFIPWVSNAEHSILGVGAVEVVPRKILLLYTNTTTASIEERATAIANFDYSAFPLEFMGFVPVLQSVDSDLPEGVLRDRYAGIITWFDVPVVKDYHRLENWLSKQIGQGMPVLFMENFGVPRDSPLLKLLQVSMNERLEKSSNMGIQYKDKSIGYEAMPGFLPMDFFQVTAHKAKVLLRLVADGKTEDAIAITPWGGYVLQPFDAVVLPNGQSRWVVNPFEFFRQTLRLPDIPIADITTSSGRRILTFHVDGDAFISLVPWKQDAYSGEVMLEEIFERYRFPITVSIIQREFELLKPYPQLQRRLEGVAREMFALPWVQIASHTYSHPLQWGKLVEGKPNTPYLSYPDKNYLLSYDTEINGSTNYINRQLAPRDKKVSIMFWSGDANLQEKPLALTYQAGLKNINGMAKMFLNSSKSVMNLAAMGIRVGGYYQIFAPIPNDFQYTDDWSVPLYGFQNVIHTFELTESPDRYKPMSVYYHFYSSTDQASLRALKRVYEWVSKQESIPLLIGDYVSKVMAFNQLVIAKNLKQENQWLIMNNGSLREFRWPQTRGMPIVSKASNVTGFVAHNQDYYVHLGPQGTTSIQVTKDLPTTPYLISANAELTEWQVVDDKHLKFSLRGYMPLSFKLGNMTHCLVLQNNQPILASAEGYFVKGATSGQFEIQCTE